MDVDAQVEDIKTTIRRHHVDLLRRAPVACGLHNPTTPKSSYFAWMVEWSKKAEKQISTAITARRSSKSLHST